MRGKSSHHSCFCQVLIEFFAQIFTTAIGAQGFNCFAVLLCGCPCLKCFIGFKSLIFCAQEEGDGVTHCIVCKGDIVPSTLARGYGGQSPYVGMYFISKVLGWCTDPYFRNGQACGSCKYACIAVSLLGARVQFDPNNGAALNEFAGTRGCNMAKSMVQLHDRYGLNSVGSVQHMYNLVQVPLCVGDVSNALPFGRC